MPRVAIANRQLQLDRCLPGAVFCETFDSPAPTRGRGGDLDSMRFASSRGNPDGIGGVGQNHIRATNMPTCRAGITAGMLFPPDDIQVCDGSSSNPGTLAMGIETQYYGVNSGMIRKPFDYAGRTGTVGFDADAWSQSALGTYINLNITSEPAPAPGFHILGNEESGQIPRNGLMIQWSGAGGDGDTGTTIGSVLTYADYVMTTLTPTFSLTGSARPLVLPGSLNRIRVYVSQTHLTIWESDYFTGGTFPNFRKIYEAVMSLNFTRGYVHFAIRNHATAKFGYTLSSVYHWRNIGFDGPDIAGPRGYEFPNNTVLGHDSNPPPPEGESDHMNTAFQISDGTNRTEGLWNPSSYVSPLSSLKAVDLTGATSAQLTCLLFFNTLSDTVTTSSGVKYRFNGGTWRTRLMTSLEAGILMSDAGCAGQISIVIDVLLADLVDGVNSIDFSCVGLTMGIPPLISNVDLLVYTT